MGKPGEVHVDLSEEQWAFVKSALEGQVASLETENVSLQKQVDGMQEEGCAALGLVENIFNGLTAKGKPSDIILAQMAEAAAKLLAEATPCGHKERLEEAEARLRKANCDYGDGWISDDLECGVDAEPWCGKHAVLYYIKANKEAQGKLDAVETLALEGACPGCVKKRDEACIDDGCNWARLFLRILKGE